MGATEDFEDLNTHGAGYSQAQMFGERLLNSLQISQDCNQVMEPSLTHGGCL